MTDTRPIGMFDSGIGGLTVAKEVFACMPGEKIIYLGDMARCPYGGRSEETIRTFGMQDARFLMSKDIKMLIVACNTVSSVALDFIQKEVNEIPVIGVVAPGARAAVSRTVAKRIGIIGTVATIRTRSYEKEIARLDPVIKTYGKACPLFVPLVEEGILEGDIARLVVQRYVYELINYGIDCLILGCTHYPLLMEAVQSAVGAGIQLLDSAYWTAREAKDILNAMNMRSAEKTGGMEQSRFFMTDITEGFPKNAAAFLGSLLPTIEKVKLEQLTETIF
jgi:glutamate racemase